MQHRLYKLFSLIGISALVFIVSGSLIAQDEQAESGEGRAELEMQSSIPLNPSAGSEIGFVYEAFLSPQQEGGEEEDTPGFITAQFRSTAPSVPRNQRTSR